LGASDLTGRGCEEEGKKRRGRGVEKVKSKGGNEIREGESRENRGHFFSLSSPE